MPSNEIELNDWNTVDESCEKSARQVSSFKKWTVVFACCWINIAIFSVMSSSGVVYLAIMKTFDGSTSSDASWQTTLISSIAAIVSLPAGFLTHYFSGKSIAAIGVLIISSAKVLCYFATSIFMINFLLGFVQGFGIGLVFVQLPAIITQYFDPESRSTAVGVSFAATTIGSIFAPLILDQLLQSFSLHLSCVIMGTFSATSILGTILLTPHPSSKIKTGLKEPSLLDRLKGDIQVMKNSKFILICLSYSTFYFSSVTITMLITDYAIDRGLSRTESVLLLSIISIGNLLGRLSPLITDLIGFKKFDSKMTYVVSMTVLPFIYISFPILSWLSYSAVPMMVQFTILVLVMGYFSSFQLVLAPVLLAEFLGSDKTAVTFGFVNFVLGIVSFLRPIIILIIGNDSNFIFYTFSIFPLISSSFWIYTFCINRESNNE